MDFSRDLIVDLLAERGQPERAEQAREQLPVRVEADDHVLTLGRLGLNAADLAAAQGAGEPETS